MQEELRLAYARISELEIFIEKMRLGNQSRAKSNTSLSGNFLYKLILSLHVFRFIPQFVKIDFKLASIPRRNKTERNSFFVAPQSSRRRPSTAHATWGRRTRGQSYCRSCRKVKGIFAFLPFFAYIFALFVYFSRNILSVSFTAPNCKCVGCA